MKALGLLLIMSTVPSLCTVPDCYWMQKDNRDENRMRDELVDQDDEQEEQQCSQDQGAFAAMALGALGGLSLAEALIICVDGEPGLFKGAGFIGLTAGLYWAIKNTVGPCYKNTAMLTASCTALLRIMYAFNRD